MNSKKDSSIHLSPAQRAAAAFVLIFAGEAIFFLPFVIPRVFRPTFLEVFDIGNFELGTYFSAYGLVAIFAYLIGGPIADRYPAHKLMSSALFFTGLGGFFLATIPDQSSMRWLYACWGLSTILLFWSPLMRSTRLVGGSDRQGLAFGLLDGGRGLVAALVGSLAVWVLFIFLPLEPSEAAPLIQKEAFQKVVYFFSAFVFLISFLLYFALKPLEHLAAPVTDAFRFGRIKEVLRLPAVWLQAFIIICAYSGYRVSDNFSLLAQDMLAYNEVESAGVGSVSLWLRPLAAIAAGLLADRVSSSQMTIICFLLLIIAGLSMSFGLMTDHVDLLFLFVIISTSVGVYALRGLYFAIMGEGRIPVYVTGTAVGLASIIGYLPDIYMAPLTGYMLDTYPGMEGHRYVFMLLTAFSGAGLIAAILFRVHARKSLHA